MHHINTKYVFLFILGLTILSYTSTFAQLRSNDLSQYTEQDGVPGSQVKGILVDKFGYIWLGTINGLARYDGHEFKRYISDPNDSTSINGLIIFALFEDSKGQIWVGSGPEHLNVYNPATKSFRHYTYKHLVDKPANVETIIGSIAEDAQGRIYFGISSIHGNDIQNGLFYLDEADETIKRFEMPGQVPIKNVYRMTKDPEGNIWLLSYSGTFKLDKDRIIHKIFSPDEVFEKGEFPADIKFKKNGHAWIVSTNSSLYNYNPIDSTLKKMFTPQKGLENQFLVNTLVLDRYENVWFTINNGLARFDEEENNFEFLTNVFGKSPILDLQFDSFGSLWLGTDGEGLFKYEKKAVFQSYSFDQSNSSASLTPGWAQNIIEIDDKKLLITTVGSGQESGINILDRETNIVKPLTFHSILPGAYSISAVKQDRPGDFILAIPRNGVFQFNTKTRALIRNEFHGIDNELFINKFYQDSHGYEWICSINGLYKKTVDTETYINYDLSKIEGSNSLSNEVTGVFESAMHGLWLITNNGLFLYDYKTDTIGRHGYDIAVGDVLLSQDINSFYEQPDGIAWVGTWQGGLSRYDLATKKIKTFTQNDGIPSMSIQGILSDDKNHTLWLSTFEGLSRFDIETEQFSNYSIADGIQGLLFADGITYKTSDGHFIFGGSNGITIFRPEDINKNSTPPKVFLTDFKLFNKSVIPGEHSILKKPIYDTEEIILAYNQNNIAIEFSALHYANPSKNKFSYTLENYDNDWREGSNPQDAFYPDLAPGRYIFRVKAANNNGVWNEKGAVLHITVTPPWWYTSWAYAAYVLLFICGVYGANRFSRHRVIVNEQKKSQARELAQAKEIEKAYHKLEQSHETLKATQSQLIQSEKMASLGELTAGIAHEIQNPLNFVNNFSEVNTELIDELSEEVDKGNLDEVKTIAKDIKENEQKINHHGKRADAIVKGMLQHSRSSSGVKEPTDINALADEYLRLAYHGLRAKDKSFNATIKTDFDKSIGTINIIPQDIGRVILNLITNAFYACTE
ncbi:MAG: two-component regulator propeller domain-containing protein, partial [Maribacter sp.]